MSFSLKKSSLVRAEFHSDPYDRRFSDGRTARVAAALRWLLGFHGQTPGDDPRHFGALAGEERNCFFRDYSRAMSWFHENGSRPAIATWVRDWHGDQSRFLSLQSRQISTFILLLKMKGVECAVWPWLFPVPRLCDTALRESEAGAEFSRPSLRHSFCLKVRSSVSAYVHEAKWVFFLYDVVRARSFYQHCLIAKIKKIDVACTVRNEAMSEQYWRKEQDLCADMVRVMLERSHRRVAGYEAVYEHCVAGLEKESLAFPNCFITLSFAEWKFPCASWMRPHLSSLPEGSGLQTLHIYELVVGILRPLLQHKGRFWETVVEHVLRVEFQGRGTLHFHLAIWCVPNGQLKDLVHNPEKKGVSSELGRYLQALFDCDVDIQVGSGFLNYSNGYVFLNQRLTPKHQSQTKRLKNVLS